MKEYFKKIIEFRNKRNWKQFHTPENLSKSISIEAGELLENFQWNGSYDVGKVKDELADVLIYCILMAESLDLDIEEIINNKIEKNEKKYPVEKSKGNSKKYDKL
ncbi:MAG: nucleotide pyrophosphohydrolase [Clostridiales bacterium]|nr:nucleotide pyrophosphohydrolase [Clostridiales bacterium]